MDLLSYRLKKRSPKTPFFLNKKHKRDSVPCFQGDCHFSRSVVAERLKQPTLPTWTSSPQRRYIWSCSP